MADEQILEVIAEIRSELAQAREERKAKQQEQEDRWAQLAESKRRSALQIVPMMIVYVAGVFGFFVAANMAAQWIMSL